MYHRKCDYWKTWRNAAVLVTLSLLCNNGKLFADDQMGSQAILDRIRLAYQANDAAIRTVQCGYTYAIQNIGEPEPYIYHCVYLRDGNRFRHGEYQAHGEYRSLAGEVAWDGGVASRRCDPYYQYIKPDMSAADPDAPLPYDEVFHFANYIVPVHALKGGIANPYASATRTVQSDDQIVTVTTQNAAFKGVCRYSKALGYMPVSLECEFKNFSRIKETEFQYIAIRDQAGTLYYPLHHRHYGRQDTGEETVLTFDIDASSLKVNEPIDPSNFRLPVWPCAVFEDGFRKSFEKPSNEAWEWWKDATPPWDGIAELVKTGRMDSHGKSIAAASAGKASTVSRVSARLAGEGETFLEKATRAIGVIAMIAMVAGMALLVRRRYNSANG